MTRRQTNYSIRQFFRCEFGGFTVEGSLLFPLLLVFTALMMFLCLYVYLQIIHYADSSIAAERIAYTWDNSHKNVITGGYIVGNYDDLYWRIFFDGSDSISFGQIGDRLGQKKLARLPFEKQPSGEGKADFHRGLLYRTVDVTMKSAFNAPNYLRFILFAEKVDSSGSSTVTEPVEYIRNVDLSNRYLPIIQEAITPEKFDETMEKFRSVHKESSKLPVFYSHDEAARYLRKLVGGKEDEFDTERTGSSRQVDALDMNNIAHQAYYGKKTYSDLKEQLHKEIEIIEKGLINGAVWHFFKKEKDQSIGPNEKLLKELEKHGIAIIIHEE